VYVLAVKRRGHRVPEGAVEATAARSPLEAAARAARVGAAAWPLRLRVGDDRLVDGDPSQ
jgi:hypothetical protein